MFVNQNAHQFCNGQGWMGIVEVNGDLGGELVKGGMTLFIPPDNVSKGTCHK